MQIFYYDEEFIYLCEDVISEFGEIPENATDVRPRDGLYVAKFDPDKEEWSESATQEYIDSLQPKPQPSKTEIMEQQIADLYYLIALGGM